jgi:polyisoprenoid-binding protein YceI
VRPLVLLMAALAMTGSARAGPITWAADLRRSEIVVHVFKKGVFSGLAHDHHFAARDWSATVELDGARPSRLDVVVAAGSLRDRQPGLSAKDLADVNARAAGPEVLDARRHPEIRFTSTGEASGGRPAAADARFEGELAGTLSLRGRDRPVSVHVAATREGDGWRARGSARFKQSDFGIEPYSGFLGTIAVHDEVEVTYDLFLRPVP